MNYLMTAPCKECPYLIGSGFSWRSLVDHAIGEFPCHKACDVNEETGDFEARSEKTPHCAGALIFLEAQNKPHQMMRICERIGMYDRRKLNMNAPVVKAPSDARKTRRIRMTTRAGWFEVDRARWTIGRPEGHAGMRGWSTWNAEETAFVVESRHHDHARWIGYRLAEAEEFEVVWWGTRRTPTGTWAAQFTIEEREP